jgi:hypothetical protein
VVKRDCVQSEAVELEAELAELLLEVRQFACKAKTGQMSLIVLNKAEDGTRFEVDVVVHGLCDVVHKLLADAVLPNRSQWIVNQNQEASTWTVEAGATKGVINGEQTSSSCLGSSLLMPISVVFIARMPCVNTET